MKMRVHHSVLAVLAVAALLVSPVPSKAQTAQACLAAQLRSTGCACAGLTTCYAKAMKKGVAVDAKCTHVKDAMLALNFSEPENLANCLVEGQAAAVSRLVQDRLATIAAGLTMTGGKCSAKKVVAVGKAARGLFRCQAIADANSVAVDPACVATNRRKLDEAFAKAEKKGGCADVGDSAACSVALDALAEDARTFLRGSGTTTTTTTTTTATSSTSTMP